MVSSRKGISLIGIVQIAMMAAITCIATMVIRFPNGLQGGYVHAGDSMVFAGVVLLGKKKGIFSASIGMFLADLLSGALYWAPFTLVIKAVMALIAAAIVFRNDYDGKNNIANTIAFIAGGIWMIVGYFFAGLIIYRLTIPDANSIQKAFLLSCADIPGNIIQALIAVVIAVPLLILLNRNKYMTSLKDK